MRIVTFYIIFLFSNLLLSQDYSKIDSIVSKYPKKFSNVKRLASRIEKDFNPLYALENLLQAEKPAK